MERSENEGIISPSKEFDIARLKRLDQNLKIRWDRELKAPALISGKLAEPFYGITRKVVVNAATEFLEENKALFRMQDPKRDLSLINKVSDSVGNTVVAMQQTYKGIPVNGGTVRVQFAADKTVSRVSNKYQPDVDIDTEPAIGAEEAVNSALTDAGQGKPEEEYAPALSIYKHEDKVYLVWNVYIEDIEKGKLFHYFVNANDGTIVFRYNDLRNCTATVGSGTGYYSGPGSLDTCHDVSTYKLVDKTRSASGGPEIRTCDLDGTYNTASDTNLSEDSGNNWNDATTTPRKDNQGAEVDIHRYMGETVDYYQNVHGWNSYDGLGSNVYAGAHLGTDYDNAFYYPSQKKFYFGDGSATVTTFDYVTPRDVVAHEFTHAVTDHTSNLDYYNQPGGLNEAFSDIFAAFIDNDDTDIGEECTTPGFPGDCLRRMSDPSDPGALARIPNHVLASLDTMGIGYKDTVYDGNGDIIEGDPHVNCGPMIYAAYFMLIGGTHPNSNISTDVIGYAKTEKILWHVQSIGLLGNNSATFLECREAALNAVDALYQADPNYLKIMDSVKNAFTAVGIGPDIYVRDSLSDVGTIPSIGTLYRSPDIITRTTQVANPSTTLGDMTRDDLAEDVEAGLANNYVYVRLQNRGSVAGDVTVNLYWSSPSTFATPSSWNLIGTANVTSVPPGVVTIPEIVWHSADIPPLGHFCLVAELDDPTDPAPDKTLITTGSMYSKFISESNNFAWKNIQVVDILPAGLTDLEFMIRGGSGDERAEIRFDLGDIPDESEVFIRILRRLCDGAQLIGMEFDKSNTRYAYYKLHAGDICCIREVPFHDQDESELHLYVKIPEAVSGSYELSVAQYVNGSSTGRITQILNVLRGEEFDFIGNRNTKEVHIKGCRWVSRMSESNMVGFRTLEHAHTLGYDNCAYCMEGSTR
uniref:Bacillolysin n=1 Tax=Candidatus Methanogaster sp. ANME-2c ERB4 TaxID=2759911 RepID=A0A7G9YJZ8_9EURY|nr:hypothetical protein JOGJOBCI_00002 [Methanosarcinales archaeon ANME-2c ERB4]QNO48332.1 hypothetical protein KDGELCJN_00015 [Methanosarcinales archaeon ANME-2c ERB4]